MDYKFLDVSLVNAVALVKVNRVEKLNALNGEIINNLVRLLENIEADKNIKVIILTGAGDKAFVAGADIYEMANLNTIEAYQFAKKGTYLLKFIDNSSKIIISAVNGYALGGGFELALAADIIIASKNAKFGFPEVTLGIIPGFGGTQNLPRAIGPYLAKELIFSGRIIEATEAFDLGLVNKIVEPDKLMDTALELAKRISSNGYLAVSAAKESITNGLNVGKNEGLNFESNLFAKLFSTNDQKEGMKAFLEKRKPEFKNM
jgi:enoyl-CoA hydratase